MANLEEPSDHTDYNCPLIEIEKDKKNKTHSNIQNQDSVIEEMKCEYCNMTFVNSLSLETHKSKKHAGCVKYDRVFTTEPHKIAAHSKAPTKIKSKSCSDTNHGFTCKICNCLFKREDQLVTHSTLSHNEKSALKKRGRLSKKDILAKKIRLKGILETMKIKTAKNNVSDSGLISSIANDQNECEHNLSITCNPKSEADKASHNSSNTKEQNSSIANNKYIEIDENENGHNSLIATNQSNIIDDKDFCHICCKSFGSLKVLERHLKKHLNSKPCVCKLCDQNFTDVSILKKHVSTHDAVETLTVVDVKSLFRLVHDEETAVTFLQMKDIIPKEQICRNGHQMKLCFSADKHIWRCYKLKCGSKQGIRKNSWLQNSKISLETVVYFIYYWANELTSIKFCAKELNMSQPTVVEWNNCLREVCVWRIEQEGTMIGGEGMIVEIDESLFVRRKNTPGGDLPQQWVFGGICRETKECFIFKVPDRSAETLMPIIRERVRPGSIIVSDCWQAYKDISNSFENETSEHRYNFVDPVTLAYTQQIEKMWGYLKWGNKRRRGTDRNFMDSYLAEFIWRTKLNGRDPFETILQDIASFLR